MKARRELEGREFDGLVAAISPASAASRIFSASGSSNMRGSSQIWWMALRTATRWAVLLGWSSCIFQFFGSSKFLYATRPLWFLRSFRSFLNRDSRQFIPIRVDSRLAFFSVNSVSPYYEVI